MPGDKETPETAMEKPAREVTEKAAKDARQATRDHSQDRQAEITEAAKAALGEHASNIKARITAEVRWEMTSMIPVTIKTSSGATGVSVVTPFDLTRDKKTYQLWQTWSE